MASDIKINVKAEVAQAQKALDSLNKSVENLEETTAKNAGFKQFGLTLTDIKSGVDLAFGAMGAAVQAAQTIWKETGAVAVEYAEQVRDLGRISGTTAEETSRLIQTADDLKVEYGTLQQAAKKLALEGIALTTETLADASDEYLAIADAGQRAQYAFEKFGRAGEDMTKILETGGDALRKMAKEQDKGLILTKEQVDAAREFEKAEDSLNDSVLALKISLGNGLLPVLVKVLEAINDLIAGTDKDTEAIKGMAESSVTLGGTLEEVNQRITEQATAQGYLIGKYGEVRTKGGQLVEGMHLLTQAEYDNALASQAASRAAEMVAQDMDAVTVAEGKTKTATDGLTVVSKNLVTDALKPLTAEMLNNKIMATLTGDALLVYAQKTGQLDQKSYETLTALQKLTAEYDKNSDGLIDAKEAAQGYWEALNKLDGKKVNITITTNRVGEKWGGEQLDFASGGSFIIPPGYPNDSYPLGPGVWAQSGEKVTVTPTGSVPAPSTGTVINVIGWSGDAASLAREIDRQAALERLLV